jgi:hypothetical protein
MKETGYQIDRAKRVMHQQILLLHGTKIGLLKGIIAHLNPAIKPALI